MILIEYANGRVEQGILMALQGDRMRIAVKDHGDALECHLVSGVWVTEDSEPVKFKCMLGLCQVVNAIHQSEPDPVYDRLDIAHTDRDAVN